MARSHSPGTAGSRSRLLCSRCLRGLSEQRPQKNCKAVLKKRKMRINSSLEFKFFSMEIIFDDFFTDVLSGCLFVHWEKKGGRRQRGRRLYSLRLVISTLRSIADLGLSLG